MPGTIWTALCRGIPQILALGLIDGICGGPVDIGPSNGNKATGASAEGRDICVGGMMDVRSAWNLLKQDATAKPSSYLHCFKQNEPALTASSFLCVWLYPLPQVIPHAPR